LANLLTVDALGINNGVRVNEREKLVRYKLTLSGAYVQGVRGSAVGEVLDLTKVIPAGNAPDQLWGPTGPSKVYVLSVGNSGYSMSVIPGVDNLHWILMIFSGVAAQLAAGAYPAALLADVDILIESTGRRFD
jgi:hypothetical protein